MSNHPSNHPLVVNITEISNADLGALQRDANAGVRAALAIDNDDLYAAACEVARIYRLEIQRRTEQAIDDQRALDRLNAALRGVSIAAIEAERA